MNQAVFGFGCPRSGTSLLGKALGVLRPGYFTAKLPETSTLHPCRSETGLRHMEAWLGDRLVLVRIVRHPLEVVESFEHARVRWEQDGARAYEGLGSHSRDGVISFLRSESENVASQGLARLVTVRYEDIGNKTRLWETERSLSQLGVPWAAAQRLVERLTSLWGTPVREGRLRDGVHGVLSPEDREAIARELRDVIEREGYGT